MFKTKIMDMADPQQVEDVLVAYYLLFTYEMKCIEQRNTPETDHLADPRVIVVCAYNEDDNIVGVIMVDNDAVLYPTLAGDPVETLRALLLTAYEANGHYLEGQTDNQFIVDLVLAMEIPEIKREGNYFWWGDRASKVASPWGAGR